MLGMSLAMLLGACVGFERKRKGQTAGVRTFSLIAMGATLAMILSIYVPQAYLGLKHGDPGRIAAQVVTGIGFLGAGTIIFQKNVVHGLTTAAGLWVTAAIGLSCGTGMFAVAGATTVLVLLGLEVVNALHPHRSHTIISLSFSSTDKQMLPLMQKRLREAGFELKTYEMREKHSSHGCSYDVVMELQARRGGHISKLLACVSDVDDVSISNTD